MAERPLGRGAFFGLLALWSVCACGAVLGIEDRHVDPTTEPADSGPSDPDPGSEGSAPVDTGAPPAEGGDPTSRYRTAVMADTPALYFRFGEPAGSTSVRNEVDGLHATYPASGIVLGVAGPLQGDSNTAISFRNGTINVAEGLDFAGTAACAIELWMRRDTAQPNPGFVIDHELWDSPGRRGWDIHTNAEDFNYDRFSGTAGSGATLGAVTLNQWHHWVVSFNAGKILVYFDGTLQGQQDALSIPATPGNWRIGGTTCAGCGDTGFYEGSLDELAIYTHTLTAAQVTAHYAAAH